MKILKIIIRIIINLIVLILVIVNIGDIFQYSSKPENYYLGSESMVGVGGWSYSSEFSFIFLRSLVGFLAIIFSILSLKTRKIKPLLLVLLCVILLLCLPMCFML
jgi:hypothetical protein